MHTGTNYRFQRSASRLTIGSHLFGILALILLLVWLLHYRGGLDYDSNNPDQVFNVHPFLMFFGFIFCAGEAMMAYKTVRAEHKVQKYVHGFLHLVALCTGIWGICAVFRFHDMAGNLEDMFSLHSWIGLTTIVLFGLQWLFGFATFLFPRASEQSRVKMLPWHMSFGRVLLYMSVSAAISGLMEKSTFLRGKISISERELHLINFTGLSILLFGIFVDLSVALARYV